MSSELAPYRPENDALTQIVLRASEFANRSRAKNTIRAYRADWDDFMKWCQDHDQASLPALPETVAFYLTDLSATHKPATLTRRVSAISQAHQMAGLESPTLNSKVRLVMSGIRRAKGTAQTAKAPVLMEDLRNMVAHLPDSLLGIRDRALLLIGFSGAFRRSELMALDVADLTFSRDGFTILIRRSKTDQEGEGRKIGIPYGSNAATCPVRSLQDWMTSGQITKGPLFRPVNRHGKVAAARLSSGAVAEIVKRYAVVAGLNASEFAGHSLRSGFATAAAMKGASERSIQNQTGHRSLEMLRRYIRDGSLFRENAASVVGL